ncbi:MAG: glycosyltransferase family 4 protein [Calditrichia bacterium]
MMKPLEINKAPSNLRLAYIGPEIPALSATFIYREILALERRGIYVLSLSVHKPGQTASETEAWELARRTDYLYAVSLLRLLIINLFCLCTKPVSYLSTLSMVASDIGKTGIAKPSSYKLLYQFMVAVYASRQISQNNCSHVHAHFAHVPTQIAMYAASLSGVPFSFTSHANDLFQRGSLLAQKVERSTSAVTISEFNRRWLREQGIHSSKVSIVRCGVNTSEFVPKVQEETSTRRPKIGSLGRLVEKKGLDVLLRAACSLSCEGQNFELEIAGNGPLEAELLELVNELGLQNHVSFCGSIAHDNVADWMKGLDMFVLACKRDRNGDQDGIPVVLMEAMALGVPVISTRISGIPELIHDGFSGRLALPGDVPSLTEAIREALNFPRKTANMASVALNRIEEEFAEPVNVNRLLQIFAPQRNLAEVKLARVQEDESQ